jgi:hypothetical protein
MSLREYQRYEDDNGAEAAIVRRDWGRKRFTTAYLVCGYGQHNWRCGGGSGKDPATAVDWARCDGHNDQNWRTLAECCEELTEYGYTAQ